jgi:aldehyde:ferredoxin oxidoreductase
MVIDEPTLEEMKDAYYRFRNWDLTTGNPTQSKLEELGLQ